ncbi:hypothetical protein PR003_g34845, partial [Phytophthora rubi]
MGLGHCEGLMEDAVYGSIASTEELMMVKTAYASGGAVDRRILSSIITPTPMDPLRALQIKWCVNGSAPKIVSSMVRKRDFVYVESSGIVMNHSVDYFLGRIPVCSAVWVGVSDKMILRELLVCTANFASLMAGKA